MSGVGRWNEGGEVGWNRIGEEVGKLKKIGEGGGWTIIWYSRVNKKICWYW